MCVIAIKPRKVQISFSTIDDMFHANPHGAGLAVVERDKTIISKGYMDVESLWKDVNNLQDTLLVLHFRWSTHGATNQEMTHPFIINSDLNTSTQIYAETTEPVLVHNGILHGYGNTEISDTCDFAINTLYPLPIDERLKLLRLTSSKYAYIHEGKIHRIGDFKKYKRLKVSNTDFNFCYFNHFKTKGYKNDVPLILDDKISDYGNEWQNDDTFLPQCTYSIEKGK